MTIGYDVWFPRATVHFPHMRMHLRGRRRLLMIFTDTGQPAPLFVGPRPSYQSGSSGILRSNSHPS